MGKAILEYKLPEEQDEFTLARNGGEYYSILFHIENIIRSHNKYGVKLKDCWEKLVEVMSEFKMDEVE